MFKKLNKAVQNKNPAFPPEVLNWCCWRWQETTKHYAATHSIPNLWERSKEKKLKPRGVELRRV